MVGCGSVATAARLPLQPACPDKLGLGAGGGAQNGPKHSSARETSCLRSKQHMKQLLGSYRSAGVAVSGFTGGTGDASHRPTLKK